jgi:hypothetical protein
MKTDSELRESMVLRCKSALAALDDCPPPGIPFCRAEAREIMGAAERGSTTRNALDVLDSQLDQLIKRLQLMDDAGGEKVLSPRRWERFFADPTWDS